MQMNDKKDAWKSIMRFGLGAGVGALVMYLVDPGMGRTRRARVRDKAVSTWNHTNDAVRGKSRDVGNRIAGILAETRSRLRSPRSVPDRKLRERVRSRIGSVVSNPGAIQVRAEEGRVILSGPVPAREVSSLLSRVRSVRGVREVENRLEVHEHPDIPSLQGTGA